MFDRDKATSFSEESLVAAEALDVIYETLEDGVQLNDMLPILPRILPLLQYFQSFETRAEFSAALIDLAVMLQKDNDWVA